MESYIIQIKSDDYNKLVLENARLTDINKKLEEANKKMFEMKAKEFMETKYDDYIIGQYNSPGAGMVYMQIKKDDKRLENIFKKMNFDGK